MNDICREKHSVNCYFCGVEFDEREGTNADEFNNNDGGSCCSKCLKHFVTMKKQWRILDVELNELFKENT